LGAKASEEQGSFGVSPGLPLIRLPQFRRTAGPRRSTRRTVPWHRRRVALTVSRAARRKAAERVIPPEFSRPNVCLPPGMRCA